MNVYKIAALLLVFAVAGIPQASTNQLYTRTAIIGDPGLKWGNVIVDAPIIMSRDARGRVHLSLGLASAPQLILAGAEGMPTQAFIDTSYVTFRTQVPTVPGPCVIGTGGWAAGNGYFFACVANAAGDGFIWARTALDPDWK